MTASTTDARMIARSAIHTAVASGTPRRRGSAGSCGRDPTSGGAASASGMSSERGKSSGGVWCQVLLQWAQRTTRPALPSARGSTRYRVVQSGQVTIMGNAFCDAATL